MQEEQEESEYWNQFQDALFRSIMDIDQCYFEVDRNEDIPAWRERVYCYELFHQLRHHLPKGFPYTLHGEIDKRGHGSIGKAFEDYYKKYCQDKKDDKPKYPNPDFVVHVPKTRKNLVVMEVKSTEGDYLEYKYKKDIDKLEMFIRTEKIKYEYGIFLIYGPTDQKEMIKDCVKGQIEDLIERGKLHILHHKEVGKIPCDLSFQLRNGP